MNGPPTIDHESQMKPQKPLFPWAFLAMTLGVAVFSPTGSAQNLPQETASRQEVFQRPISLDTAFQRSTQVQTQQSDVTDFPFHFPESEKPDSRNRYRQAAAKLPTDMGTDIKMVGNSEAGADDNTQMSPHTEEGRIAASRLAVLRGQPIPTPPLPPAPPAPFPPVAHPLKMPQNPSLPSAIPHISPENLRQSVSGKEITLTLDEVRQTAFLAHPAYNQSVRQAAALHGSWIQAGLKENPTLEYMAAEMKDGNPGGKQGFGVSQTIIPKYKIDARKTTASREYQAARIGCDVRRGKIENDALLAAYRVAISERKLSLIKDLLGVAEDALKAGTDLLQAQEISRAEYLESKIEAERTRIALGDAEIAYGTNCRELALLLGLPVGQPLHIADSLDTLPEMIDAAILLGVLLAQSPEMRQAYAELESARAKVRQECAEAGIDFDANVSVLQNTGDNETEVSAGLAIPLRIRNRNQGNISRARQEFAAARENIRRLELRLATEVEKIQGDYLTARNRVLIYRNGILSEAEESLKLALDAYRQGQFGALELLDAQRTLFNVKIEYVDSLGAMWEARTLLDGDLLSGGLDAP